MSTPENSNVNVTLPKDVKEKLQEAAQKNQRSLTKEIRFRLIESLNPPLPYYPNPVGTGTYPSPIYPTVTYGGPIK